MIAKGTCDMLLGGLRRRTASIGILETRWVHHQPAWINICHCKADSRDWQIQSPIVTWRPAWHSTMLSRQNVMRAWFTGWRLDLQILAPAGTPPELQVQKWLRPKRVFSCKQPKLDSTQILSSSFPQVFQLFLTYLTTYTEGHPPSLRPHLTRRSILPPWRGASQKMKPVLKWAKWEKQILNVIWVLDATIA